MHDVVQLVISPAFNVKRRLSVRLKLARIRKGRIATGTGVIFRRYVLCRYSYLRVLLMAVCDVHGQVVH